MLHATVPPPARQNKEGGGTTGRGLTSADAYPGILMTARLRMLNSTPLRPLAERMSELADACTALDVATAFVTRDAVDHAIAPAAERGARVRFLTGTFGNTTRLMTFRHLASMAEQDTVAVRVWNCGSHGNLHTKLYVWTLEGGRRVAWIGSANLTDGGLQNDGELVAEVELAPRSSSLAEVQRAFEREWSRGMPIDDAFLRAYREAPRTHSLTDVFRRKRRGKRARPSAGQRFFAVLASQHHEDGSPKAERIGRLLGAAGGWYDGGQRFLSDVRTGDWCLHVDTVDDDIGIVAVTDVEADGRRHVFAFEPIVDDPWKPLRKLRASLVRIGLRTAGSGFRSGWLDPSMVPKVLAVLYPDEKR